MSNYWHLLGLSLKKKKRYLLFIINCPFFFFLPDPTPYVGLERKIDKSIKNESIDILTIFTNINFMSNMNFSKMDRFI